MKKNLHCKTWLRKVAAVAVASCFVIASPAHANPIGANVASGVVSMAQQDNTLNITNSPGAIINWQGFSIGVNEATRFIQQSASSGVLNRVVGQDPSSILGALQSNGRVFLINPNGVLFGAGAQVDVAGLVVSTLNLSNADFLNGRYNFTAHANAGGIENQGSLTALPGGQIYLIAPNLRNSGVITSPQGDVILAAGNSVELVNAGSPDMRVVIDAPNNQVLNLGSIVANSGRVGIYAGLINHHGIVSADTAIVGATGKITFKASRDITLNAGSRIEANGPKGGSVTVQAEGGTLLASGVIEAKGSADKGGEIRLLGNQVGLIENATVDASGQTGGGSVLIGGDRHGDNPTVQNAWRTYLGLNAIVKADAIQNGNGGKVIVWSDDITRFYGSISARGGASSGNGGFVEVSGKNNLDFAGLVNAGASNGLAGTLLLDPTNIVVATAGGAYAAGTNNLFASAGATTTITPASLAAANASVVLQATNDITISNAVNLTTAGAGFVAQAGHDININASLTTTGGNIILEADSPHSGASFDGSGMVNINAPVNACSGAAGGCAGGNITLIGGGNRSQTGGFGFSLNANVQAGNGGINVALSQTQNTPALNFFIGAGGNAQLSSNDTGYLLSTGRLVLGTATTAGTDGYGTGAISLLVNSLSQLNASPVALSTSSGSTFELFAGTGGITLDRNLTTFQPTVINTAGTFTLNAALDTSNHDLFITQTTGNLTVNGSISAGRALLKASAGNIVLNQAVSGTGGGDSVVLVAGGGGNFVNNFGATAIDPGTGGRFLVYSTTPMAGNRNGLPYAFRQYNAPYGTAVQTTTTGSGFLYSAAPSVTANLSGSATKTYDGDATAPTGSLVLTYSSGAIDSDLITALAATTAIYDNKNVGTNKLVTVSAASVSATSTDGKPVYGYQITPVSAAIGTITSPTIIEQLVNTQIIQLNYFDNILASGSVLNPVSPIVSAGLLATSAYLETQTGQTMPLSPIFSIDPGVYTNIDTGETTLIQAGATLEPGIYFNQATSTVVVVTLDQNTGQIVMLSGAVSESQVAAGAKVVQMEPNACR